MDQCSWPVAVTGECVSLKTVRETEIMGMDPLVSVIIPTYQVAQYIAATLDSVLAQTFKDYEIIVVIDGSSDTEELEKVLAPYRDRISYLRQEHQGVSAARNTGIRAARGKYIAPLVGDDMWASENLAAQLALLEADPSLDMVYAAARHQIMESDRTTKPRGISRPVNGMTSMLAAMPDQTTRLK